MEKTHFFRFESPYQSPDGRFSSVFAPTSVKLKTIRSRIFDPKGVKNRPHLTPRPTAAVKPKCQLQKKKPKFIIWVTFLTLTCVNCDQLQIGFTLKSYISYKSQIFFANFWTKFAVKQGFTPIQCMKKYRLSVLYHLCARANRDNAEATHYKQACVLMCKNKSANYSQHFSSTKNFYGGFICIRLS